MLRHGASNRSRRRQWNPDTSRALHRFLGNRAAAPETEGEPDVSLRSRTKVRGVHFRSGSQVSAKAAGASHPRTAVHGCRPGEAAGFSGPDFQQPFFLCLWLEALTCVSAAFSSPSTASTVAAAARAQYHPCSIVEMRMLFLILPYACCRLQSRSRSSGQS
jgi:hypothetical protein